MAKILFIQVHSGIGGATTSLYQLVSGLKKRGLDLEVLITGGDGPLREWLEKEGIRVYLLSGLLSYGHGNGARTPFWSIPPFRPITDLRHLPSTIKKYRKFFQSHSFDLIYLNSSILWPAAIAARKEGKKVITHVREVWYHGLMGFRKSIFVKLTENNSDRIFTLSHFSKSQFYSPQKVEVVYNAVDFSIYDQVNSTKGEIRKKLGLKTDQLYVITLGGAMPHKGGHTFLKAAEIVRRSDADIHFIILGRIAAFYPEKAKNIRGILRSWLVKDPGRIFLDKLNRKGLKSKMVLPGAVRNVAEWIKASDILVFPATEDHFGRPILEAGYMRVPVIASDGNTSLELIPKNRNGLVFKSGNASDLACKILFLSENPNLRKEMGEEGRNLAEQRYDLRDQLDKVFQIILQIRH